MSFKLSLIFLLCHFSIFAADGPLPTEVLDAIKLQAEKAHGIKITAITSEAAENTDSRKSALITLKLESGAVYRFHVPFELGGVAITNEIVANIAYMRFMNKYYFVIPGSESLKQLSLRELMTGTREEINGRMKALGERQKKIQSGKLGPGTFTEASIVEKKKRLVAMQNSYLTLGGQTAEFNGNLDNDLKEANRLLEGEKALGEKLKKPQQIAESQARVELLSKLVGYLNDLQVNTDLLKKGEAELKGIEIRLITLEVAELTKAYDRMGVMLEVMDQLKQQDRYSSVARSAISLLTSLEGLGATAGTQHALLGFGARLAELQIKIAELKSVSGGVEIEVAKRVMEQAATIHHQMQTFQLHASELKAPMIEPLRDQVKEASATWERASTLKIKTR